MNTLHTQHLHDTALNCASVTGKNDPILQELWAVKAKLNADAGYTVEGIVANLKIFLATVKTPK
jgi:hypothetical protein